MPHRNRSREKPRGTAYPSGPGNNPGANGLLASLGQSKYPIQPPPLEVTLASSRRVSTDIFEDRIMVNKPSVFFIGASGSNWVLSSSLTYLANNLTGTSPTINNLFGSWSREIYSRMARTLMASRKVLVRDTILDQAGSVADSFGLFMNQYINTYCALRTLEGFLNAGSFNTVTAQIAQAIDQFLPRLLGDLDRLYSIPMSPMFCRYLDRICGPKMLDKDSAVVSLQWAFSGTVLDYSIATNIGTILTSIETNLSLMFTPTAVLVADFQRIMNILAMSFGTRNLVPPKQIVMDPVEWALNVAGNVTWRDSTAVKVYTEPSSAIFFSAGSGSPIAPIILPSDANRESEAAKQAFSLWRPAIFTNDPITGVAVATSSENFGLTNNNLVGGSGTKYGWYAENGAFTAAEFAGAGLNTNLFDPLISIAPFAADAGAEITSAAQDTRAFKDWEFYYTPSDWLLEETVYIGTQMFVGEMVGM